MVAPHARGRPSGEGPGLKTASWILLAAILAGATFLYMRGLGDRRLVGDEFMAAEMAAESPAEILRQSFAEAIDPAYSRNRPAFHLTTWGAGQVVDDLELSARLPAALAGLLAVAGLFFLGREVHGEREGLLAAALLGASHSFVWASRQALGYAPMVACLVLALYGAVRAVRAERGTGARWWGMALAAVGLGYYFHPIMVLPGGVLVAALCVAGVRGKRWRELGLGLGAGLLVLLPAISVVARILWHSVGPQGAGKFLDDRGMRPVSFLDDDGQAGVRALEFLGPDSVVGFAVIAGLALVGWWTSVRRSGFVAWTCLALLVAPLVFVTSVSLGHGWAERYLIFLLVPLALLQARGLVTLAGIVPSPPRLSPGLSSGLAPGLALLGAGALAAWNAPAWNEGEEAFREQDWAGLSQALLEETRGPTVLIAGHTGGRLLAPSYNMLYLGRPELIFHLDEEWPRFRYTTAGETTLVNWDAPSSEFLIEAVGGVLIHVREVDLALRVLESHPVRVQSFEGLSLILHRTSEAPGQVQLAEILLALADAGAHPRDALAMTQRSLRAMTRACEEGEVPSLGYLGRVTKTCDGRNPVGERDFLIAMDEGLQELLDVFGDRPAIRQRLETALQSSVPTLGRARVGAGREAWQAGDIDGAVRNMTRAVECGAVEPQKIEPLLEHLRETGRLADVAALETALAASD